MRDAAAPPRSRPLAAVRRRKTRTFSRIAVIGYHERTDIDVRLPPALTGIHLQFLALDSSQFAASASR
jgi:hypothetical protein